MDKKIKLTDDQIKLGAAAVRELLKGAGSQGITPKEATRAIEEALRIEVPDEWIPKVMWVCHYRSNKQIENKRYYITNFVPRKPSAKPKTEPVKKTVDQPRASITAVKNPPPPSTLVFEGDLTVTVMIGGVSGKTTIHAKKLTFCPATNEVTMS